MRNVIFKSRDGVSLRGVYSGEGDAVYLRVADCFQLLMALERKLLARGW
jgi:hypothetical protein